MTAADTLSGLRAARALVEKGWTQGALARDKYGRPRLSNSPLARSWCAGGACLAAMGEPAFQELRAQLLRDGFRGEFAWVHNWNDAPERTQADVLGLFDRTIAQLEADAAVSS